MKDFRISIRIDSEDHKVIKKWAKKHKITVVECMRRAIMREITICSLAIGEDE